MALRPEHPTIVLNIEEVANAINSVIGSSDTPEHLKIGLEQLAVIQMFLIRAAGSIVEEHWKGADVMRLHDVSAILTALSIAIDGKTGGLGDPRVVQMLAEGCTAILGAASNMVSRAASEQGDASPFDFGNGESR